MEAVALCAFGKDGCLILRLDLGACRSVAIDDLDPTTTEMVLGLDGIETIGRKLSPRGDTASEGYDVLGRVELSAEHDIVSVRLTLCRHTLVIDSIGRLEEVLVLQARRNHKSPPMAGRESRWTRTRKVGNTHATCPARCPRQGSDSGWWRASGRGPTAPGRRIGVEDSAGVVMWPGIFRVRILGEDDEIARIISPVAQRCEVERTPDRGALRRGLHPRERISVPHTPPSLHVDLHLRGQVRGDVTVHRNGERNHAGRGTGPPTLSGRHFTAVKCGL